MLLDAFIRDATVNGVSHGVIASLSQQLRSVSGCCGNTFGFLRSSHTADQIIKLSRFNRNHRRNYSIPLYNGFHVFVLDSLYMSWLYPAPSMVLSYHFKKEKQQKQQHTRNMKPARRSTLRELSVHMCLYKYPHMHRPNRLILRCDGTCGRRTINLNGDNETRAHLIRIRLLLRHIVYFNCAADARRTLECTDATACARYWSLIVSSS